MKHIIESLELSDLFKYSYHLKFLKSQNQQV